MDHKRFRATLVVTLFLGAVLRVFAHDLLLTRSVSGVFLLWLPGFAILSAIRYLDHDVSITDIAVLPIMASSVTNLILAGIVFFFGLSPSVVLYASYVAGLFLIARPPSLLTFVVYNKYEQLILSAILLAVSIFIIVPHWDNPRITLSFHGSFHSSIVYTIIHTGIIPTNPGFAWEQIRHYWPFHMLLAVFTEITNTPPPVVAIGLNFISALGILVVIRDITDHLVDGSWRANIGAVLAVFVGFSILNPAFRFLLNYTVWDGRISTFFRKFLNVSGFPFALLVSSCLIYLFIKTYHTQRYPDVRQILLFVACAVLLFLVHPTTALFVYPTLMFMSLLSVLHQSINQKTLKSQVFMWTVNWILIASLTLPFYVHISSIGTYETAISIFPPEQGSSVLISYLGNLANFVFPYLATAPILFFGLFYAWKHRSETPALSALAAGGVVIGMLGSIMFLSDGNQYKAAYIAMLFLAPVIGVGINQIGNLTPQVQYSQVIVGLIVILLFTTPATILWVDYLSTQKASNDNYQFEGKDITFSSGSEVDREVIDWIRAETPSDSALVFDPVLYEKSSYELGSTEMIFSSSTQRSLYYGGDALPIEYLQYRESTTRERVRTGLFRCSGKRYIPTETLKGPLYLVVSENPNRNCELVSEYYSHQQWDSVQNSSRLHVFRYTQ